MTLAIPTNLVTQKNVYGTVVDLLHSLPGPMTYHVVDGKVAATPIGPVKWS